MGCRVYVGDYSYSSWGQPEYFIFGNPTFNAWSALEKLRADKRQS